MTRWNHKAAHAIARAVDMHINGPTVTSQQGHLLLGVYKDAKRAASTDKTSAEDLSDIRKSLCFVCRGRKLYTCDADEGWSPNCAFIGNEDR
jgi:hypothetical protein